MENKTELKKTLRIKLSSIINTVNSSIFILRRYCPNNLISRHNKVPMLVRIQYIQYIGQRKRAGERSVGL